MAVFCLNCICSFIYIYNGCNTLQLFLFIALAGKYHFLLSMDPSGGSPSNLLIKSESTDR
ncbi:Hypothetical predicted protein [Podarcis lilfordi]|uniref:Uncharacterized protein n=1 Tax=Podarcis lilfordi TaxID=74358 RepID=A0AA35PGT8_9SAUR|nr:Hypothetical predicted protein [Podarcis lilfordi]